MMSKQIKAAIVGSTGYGGVELIRLLKGHPQIEVAAVLSSSSAGDPIAEGFPHLTDIMTDTLEAIKPEQLKEQVDLVFMATPSGVSARLAPQFLDVGLKVVDLSGDYRLTSAESYKQWYKHDPAEAEYLSRAVYGLTEIYPGRISGADFIANPGCYPTSALLGLIPAVRSGWIKSKSLIIDGKSGVSGAGRGLSQRAHFAEMNENFLAYKVNQHQHIPEIEQVLTDAAAEPVTVTFTSHLVPMTRGILNTMYMEVAGDHSEQDFVGLYREFYKNSPFVRVLEAGKWPATKQVWGSNYCDIGFALDPRTGRLTILSAIDNLVKGAAGQAIQNVNVMMGWDETTGLDFVPVYP